MGPREAARAVSMIKPEIVIPMHYNTFPPIAQDPEVFAGLVKKEQPDGVDVRIFEPGEHLTV